MSNQQDVVKRIESTSSKLDSKLTQSYIISTGM